MIWETEKFEEVKELIYSSGDLNVKRFFEQFYNMHTNLAHDFQRLDEIQKKILKDSLISTLGVNEVIVKINDEPEIEYLTTNDVSKILGISPQAVRKWCESGKLNAKRTFGDYGEWKISTDQFMKNEEIREKFRNVIRMKREKQLKTNRALTGLSKINYYDEEDYEK